MALAMLAASAVASTVGFGIGMAATPIALMLLDPQDVVVIVHTVSLVVYALVAHQTRGHLPGREMAPVILYFST